MLVEAHVHVIALGTKHDRGDVFQTDQRVTVLPDHQLPELIGRMQIGGGGQIDGNHRALGLTYRGQHVVARQRCADIGGRHAQPGHALRLHPDAHGKGPGSKDLRLLHALHRLQLGLHDPCQVVGDLVVVQHIGEEGHVHRCRGLTHGQVDGRVLGLRW